MLTVKPVYKLLNVSDDKHTWHHFHSLSRHNNIYGFGRPFWLLHFLPILHPSTHISTIHIRFYLSKWWVDGSLHKTMLHPAFTVPVKAPNRKACNTIHTSENCYTFPVSPGTIRCSSSYTRTTSHICRHTTNNPTSMHTQPSPYDSTGIVSQYSTDAKATHFPECHTLTSHFELKLCCGRG